VSLLQANPSDPADRSGPPDIAEPWATVLALGVTQITGWGTIFYLFPLLLDLLPGALGASRVEVVGAFSVALLLSGLLAPAVGHWIDGHGGRGLMAIGSLLAAVALAALGHVTTLWQFYVVWALLGVAMACTLYEPAFAVLTRAFTRRQRRAIATLTLFGGLASTVFWPLGQALIDAIGWRGTALVFAAINLLVCVPLHALALPRGGGTSRAATRTGSMAALRQVLRDPTFHLLAAAFTANILVFSATSVHLLAMLAAKGLTPAQAAAFGALIGPMQVAGRLAEMLFGGRLAPSRVGLIAMGLLPLSLLLLVAGGASSWSFVAFALLYGAGNGVITIVRGAIPVELYGRDHYGVVNGALAAPVLLAKAAGPLVAALALLVAPDYDTVALLLAAIAAASLVFFAQALRPRSRA
jgi:MFS family permease